MNFLEKLSQHILDHHKEKLQHLTVILPNVRSRLFLSRYIQEQAKSAIFLPRFITSKDLMEEISGVRAVDDFFLLTKLFNAYQKKVNDAYGFENFLNWGTTLLQDLKEIDHQLVDASELFSVLTDIKQLDFWNPGENGLSNFQKKYLKFCANILPIYQEFNAKLLKEKIGHAGLVDKLASQTIGSFNFHKDSAFIIAGFNALTKAEEVVFNHFEKAYSREMIFDYDHFYTDNLIHEAGYFARKNLLKYPSISQTISDDFKGKKQIDVFKCTTSYEQALLLNNLLKDIKNESELLKTAVILPDEGMLIPVLQHLPESITKVNVTMGYSLQNSPYFEYIEHIFRLYLNSKKEVDGRVVSFYYKDVVSLLNSELRPNTEENKNVSNWLSHLINQNQVFISIDEFSKNALNFPLYKTIQWPLEITASTLLHLIRLLILVIDNKLLENQSFSNKINREFLFHHITVLDQVEEVIDQLQESMDPLTVHKLWKHYTKIAKVQFTGEPLAGLQIMGILESRTLDFEQVIILNVNEGSLPDEKKVSSLIPNDLKRKFAMNLNQDRDAVIAYHFYRLLQRAKRIKLLYSNQIDSLKGGEKSRYILQLKKEILDANSDILYKEHSTFVPFKRILNHTQTVEKTAIVRSLILQKFKSGLSPTSLINFISCPLNFYFLELIGLKNKEDVTELLTQDKIGSIIHAALENLYKPFVGKVLIPDHINSMKKGLKEVLNGVYSEIVGSSQITNGKNVLSMNMAEKMISRLLDKEMVNVKENTIKILDLEVRLQKNIVLNNGEQVSIKGFIDRIEMKNGALHLIDYKTGNVAKNDLQINSDSEEDYFNKTKIFQILTYVFLVNDSSKYDSSSITASIYTIKSYNELSINLLINNEYEISKEEINKQAKRLNSLALNILDPTKVFQHLETGLYCNYC